MKTCLFACALFSVVCVMAPAAHAQQYPPPTPTAAPAHPHGHAHGDNGATDNGSADTGATENDITRVAAFELNNEPATVGGSELPKTGLNVLMLVLWALVLIAVGRTLQMKQRERKAIAAEKRERRAAYPAIHRYDTSTFVPRRSATASR